MKKYFFVFLFSITISVFAQNETWHQLASQKIGSVFSLAVNSHGVVFASVFNKGIFRSNDSGVTWIQVAPLTNKTFSFAINSSDEIIASEWSSTLYSSSDNGEHWNTFPSTIHHADVRGFNALGTIFVESEGVLYSTSDFGNRWKPLHSYGGMLISLSNGVMYSAKGDSVLRSVNNGITWSAFSSLPLPIYSLYADTSGIILAGMYSDPNQLQRGIFMLSKNDSLWEQTGPVTTINQIVKHPSGKFFAATSDSGCFVSVDSGATWVQVNTGLSASKIYSIVVLPDSTILLGTVNGIFSTKQSPMAVVDQKNIFPSEYCLEQNFPNPFNPSTTITFQMPVSGNVTLKVFDLLGREVSLLVDEAKQAGKYSVTWNAANIASGVYIYQLNTHTVHINRTMILLK